MSFKSLLPTLNSIPGSGSNQSIRYASSFAGLSNLVSRVVGRKSVEAPVVSEGLFEELAESQAKIPTISEKRIASFHKSSTGNFKTSRRKLNDLSHLITGKTVDESILQLKLSPKKQSSRLLSMVALARDHAIAKGLVRDKLVVAQSWVTIGPSLKRVDIKGRGRRGIKFHPSSKLHVLLAQGITKEEKKRLHKQDGWRRSLIGLTSLDGVGIGKSKPIINSSVGNWKW